jgi:O-succinylbenzoate synthase
MNELRQFRVYKHKFSTPLVTSYGKWEAKESIVLRRKDNNGNVTFGEVSLTPHFFSYTIDDILPNIFKWSKGESFTNNELISSAISCMESEIWNKEHEVNADKIIVSAEILNSEISGKTKCLKKKIGIKNVIQEIKDFKLILRNTPKDTSFRLDANENLSIPHLLEWNQHFKNEERLEFIEQPLGRERYLEMIDLQDKLDIKLSLDESLVFKNDLTFFENQDWRGFYTIKPSMFYDWDKILTFVRDNPNRCIISTSFESPFGFEAVCRCALFSKMVSGLDRNLFQNSEYEFLSHLKNPLFPGSVTIKMLDLLWGKLQ